MAAASPPFAQSGEPELHLRFHARHASGKPAIVLSSGDQLTYGELDRRSTRLARALRERGLATGDTVALLMENHPRYMEVVWAAQRTGLRYVAVNWHLVPEEVDYILDNSEARVLFTSVAQEKTVAALDPRRAPLRVSLDGPAEGCLSIDDLVAGVSADPLPSAWEVEGTEMLYSSGTTGRPKGIRKPLTAAPPGDPSVSQVRIARGSWDRYRQDSSAVYLVPAPLYHAAPLIAAMTGTRLGSTVVVMERFDPVRCLELIEQYRVTHVQFVPTMFVRMLRIPEEQRHRFDVSSLRYVIHAAAPCPIDVKQRMIEWLGPIIYEYYSGTEDIGGTFIDSEQWLAHPGSVGKAQPGITIHILDPDDKELAPRQQGRVFMEGGQRYEYYRDPEKTASIIGPHDWRTLGDIGWLDEEGYLYLTDRASNMIVSGGVNIYPQEVENVLSSHPEVLDVAVIGVPNEEYGEEVRAVVEPVDMKAAGPALEEQLIAHCREHLAGFKCPRAVDFVDGLPRDPNGKLYKRRLKDQYWGGHATKIV
jgi:long-chain acyl-CoA synthetase